MVSRKLVLLIGLALALLIVPLAGAQSDSVASPTIAPGESVEGVAEGEALRYSFRAQTDESFIFTITSDFTALLIVESPEGDILVSNEDFMFYTLPLFFNAPADADYTLIIDGSFGGPQGGFTLTMERVDARQMAYGDTVELEEGSPVYSFFIFEAAAGDVVNLYAFSEVDDLEMRLLDAFGGELVRDDDGGPGLNPHIRRFTLVEGGRYLVMLNPLFSGAPLASPATLTLEQTESLVLDGPTIITLGGDAPGSTVAEVVGFDAPAAGAVYRVTLSLVNTTDEYISLSMDVMQNGMNIASFYSTDLTRLVVDFRAQDAGPGDIRLTSSNFSGTTTDVEVEVVLVE